MYRKRLIQSPKICHSPTTLVVSRTLGIVWDASGIIVTRFQRALAATEPPWWLVVCVSAVSSLGFTGFYWCSFILVDFPWFLLIFMKTNKNKWKPNEKTPGTQITSHHGGPVAASVLWNRVIMIPKAPHTITSALVTTDVLGECQFLGDWIKLFMYTI